MPSFSSAELDRADSMASSDPRIAEALTETTDSSLAATLAAAPDLISRWLNAADPYGSAVITAAVIARRCGHPEPLPAEVLQPLAEKVLTPAERSHAGNHWFTTGLSWARRPVRGDAAPLTPHATIPGIVAGDQVSDVLVQHAARDDAAPGHSIAESAWLLLIEHATPQACQAIANVAYEQRHTHQLAITEQAIRKAAGAGHRLAMANLGALLREQGKNTEAEQWVRKAADARGHVPPRKALQADGFTDRSLRPPKYMPPTSTDALRGDVPRRRRPHPPGPGNSSRPRTGTCPATEAFSPPRVRTAPGRGCHGTG